MFQGGRLTAGLWHAWRLAVDSIARSETGSMGGEQYMARSARSVSIIDSHTADEPTRLMESGLPLLRGGTVVDEITCAHRKSDGLCGQLTLEPRGRQGICNAGGVYISVETHLALSLRAKALLPKRSNLRLGQGGIASSLSLLAMTGKLDAEFPPKSILHCHALLINPLGDPIS